MSKPWLNILLVIGIILLAVLPLLSINGDFGGADGKAEEMILAINPEYEPWANPLAELPSETESMLFALQAAIGAGIIGYVFGTLKAGRAEKKRL
ncbi:energy-coupling factor ABC transporter substrate-binding protein [Paenibacillus abyssi]|uniref:Cobalt transport protein CbiN n=1 Tax=Paenibacillus abyssi TaxID=1340531 RepID=A0A917LGJ7_9BACL|nr:energy-coupling factor ABC transporter substrate-binding protein [Paenibacillus abyssi]GGG22499.1 cobalt transport protein CbiN [Paenibacillus abyssi]